MHTLPVSNRITLKNILLATDFSPASKNALAFAAVLARWHGAKIFIAHVVPPEPYLGIPMEPVPVQMDLLWNAARRQLDDFLLSENVASVPHEEILRRGEIWTTISGLIERDSIDLLVIGTHGRLGLRKIVMGSVAEQIYRHAACPVLTVGPQVPSDRAGWEPLRILFPTDFSETSLQALPYALSLVEERQGTLVLFHASPLTPWQYQESVKANICKEFEKFIGHDVRCKLEFEVSFEFPSDTILAAAGKHSVDLIIMGVKKSTATALSTHLPWSTASQVVSRAHCPVLTVRG